MPTCFVSLLGLGLFTARLSHLLHQGATLELPVSVVDMFTQA